MAMFGVIVISHKKKDIIVASVKVTEMNTMETATNPSKNGDTSATIAEKV
jgi:hypothetical protein